MYQEDNLNIKDHKDNFTIKAGYEITMLVIEELATQVEKLTISCRDHNKLLLMCDEQEKNIKEELTTL